MKMKNILLHDSAQSPRQSSGKAGQALLMTVVLLGAMMIGTTVISGIVLVNAVRSATSVGFSSQAIYAADSGLEWELYQYFKPAESESAPVLSNSKARLETCSFVYFDSTDKLSVEHHDSDGVLVRQPGAAGDYLCPNAPKPEFTMRSVGISGPSGKEVRRAFELIFEE